MNSQTQVMGPHSMPWSATLSSSGTATASLNVPAGLPLQSGLKLYHAYVIYSGKTGRIFNASNPTSVTLK